MRAIAYGAAIATSIALVALATPRPASADLLVRIDKSSQRMSVVVDGTRRYTWKVSTGRAGGPPSGAYRPQRLERNWHSRKYDWAPMPYSVFFHKGYAIHGTNHIRRLGRRASHGCVRLHPANAAVLFALVRQEGMRNTRIVIAY
jgi:lipoprotein-anchoring transpeptidase ErfK/SrfK